MANQFVHFNITRNVSEQPMAGTDSYVFTLIIPLHYLTDTKPCLVRQHLGECPGVCRYVGANKQDRGPPIGFLPFVTRSLIGLEFAKWLAREPQKSVFTSPMLQEHATVPSFLKRVLGIMSSY